MAQVAGNLGLLHQMKQGGEHFGSAIGFEMPHVIARRIQVFLSSRQWFGCEFVISTAELENSEAIARP